MNTPDEWSPEEQRLHDALRHAADQVTPGPDGLARIRRRTAVGSFWRQPVMRGLTAATALAMVVIIGGTLVLNGSDDSPVVSSTSPPAPTGSHPTSPPTITAPPPMASEAPLSTEPRELTVPVYYVDGDRLTREFQAIKTADAPVLAALRQLTADALDPDYASLWSDDTEIRSAEIKDGVITVDLAALPVLSDATADRAQLAVQQLVYTATAAASAADPTVEGALPVRVTIAGQPAIDVFGQLDLSQPVERADPLQVRNLVQINNPGEGGAVTSPVTIDGEAAAFEATVQWQILQDGVVVQQDTTMAAECCVFSPFSFSVDLAPGTYQVVVGEIDVSGGEGRSTRSDSRTFTVS